MQSSQMEIEKTYDVIFVIESTAINGAYMNDLKTNYMIPTLEYFSQSLFEEREYLTPEKTSILYGVVLYKTAQSMPNNSTVTFGPFSSPQKVINVIDKLTMTGGGSESNANLAEGLATALCCFEDLRNLRSSNEINVQKHCILICNSTPYSMPVLECYQYEGKNVEQLASIFHEKKINFSIISPRKIPILFKLFVKADGDLPLTSKNFCKDPRHLVLLKGFNLKERPASPNVNSNQIHQQHPSQGQLSTVAANINSLNTQNTISNSSSMDNSQNNVIVAAMSNLQQQQNQLQSNQQQIHPAILAQQQAMQQNPNYNSNVPPVSRWLFQNQPRASFNQIPLGAAPGGMNISPNIQSQQITGNIGSNSNSVLISQLNQPPNPPGMNINQQMQNQMLTPAQQQMRMQLINQQQVNSMQQQPLNSQHQHIHQQQNQQVVLQTSSNASGSSNSSTTATSSTGEREKIWSGTLEWVEKSKTDQSKSSRCVQSQVIANVKDGEVEVKADNWPPRLLMQLMPKHLVGNIGGEFLKDSKVVVFKPQPSESLEALCKIMNSGFAGCVHFTGSPQAPSCDIRILILLYTPEKKTFLGFIPNDQTMFVDQLRKVIQQKQQPGMNSQQQPQHQHQQQHQSQQSSQLVSQGVLSGNINMVGNIGGNPLQQAQNSISQDNQQQHFNVYNQNSIQMQIQQDQMQNNMQQMNIIQQRGGIGGLMQQGPTGVNMVSIQGGSNQINTAQQSRMVRPMMSNPGLRMLLQQPGAQPGNQFRPQLQQMVGSNPNMMGGGGPAQLPRSTTYDDSNFDFM